VSGAFVHLPFMPVPELIELWSTSVAQAVLEADVPTVFTLSGPASSAPVGVPSFDTKALAKRILSDAGVPLIGLEPTGYLGNLAAFFSAPSIVNEHELRYPLPAEHRQPWISVEDQAALALAALERPDLRGRWFRIGEQLTGPELAEAIGEARGSAVRYVPLDPEDFGRSLAPLMGEQIGAALAADYRVLGQRPAELALDSDTQELRRELGVPATPVADWAGSQDWEAAAAVMNAL
jgi:nucleoside-diphosphate-sugar epimerase